MGKTVQLGLKASKDSNSDEVPTLQKFKIALSGMEAAATNSATGNGGDDSRAIGVGPDKKEEVAVIRKSGNHYLRTKTAASCGLGSKTFPRPLIKGEISWKSEVHAQPRVAAHAGFKTTFLINISNIRVGAH